MGILDALRGRKSDGGDSSKDAGKSTAKDVDKNSDGEALAPGDPAATDPTRFQPRTDGMYAAGNNYLQFGGGRVREVTDVTDPSAAAQAMGAADVRIGSFTPSGRFSVNAPFEMLVTFRITETGADYFVARRTSVVDRATTEATYRFSPSSAG